MLQQRKSPPAPACLLAGGADRVAGTFLSLCQRVDSVQQPEECFGGDGEAGLVRERLGAGEGEVKGHPSINHSLDKTLERTGVLVSSTLL